MHYTGTIWRPPYEASSLLLEVTAGCTHHKCKFCTLYNDLPFKFRMSPLEDVESDLQEAQLWSTDPISMLTARLQGLPRPERIQRAFLTGANPFVLKSERLLAIADLIRQYVPSIKTIGCFARITDVTLKSDKELASLHQAGYDSFFFCSPNFHAFVVPRKKSAARWRKPRCGEEAAGMYGASMKSTFWMKVGVAARASRAAMRFSICRSRFSLRWLIPHAPPPSTPTGEPWPCSARQAVAAPFFARRAWPFSALGKWPRTRPRRTPGDGRFSRPHQ